LGSPKNTGPEQIIHADIEQFAQKENKTKNTKKPERKRETYVKPQKLSLM
jgi:hypothetical protein